jgi:hypothetical protein
VPAEMVKNKMLISEGQRLGCNTVIRKKDARPDDQVKRQYKLDVT